MPRVGREKSESGVYHVMMRGINRQDIFLMWKIRRNLSRFCFVINLYANIKFMAIV